jgi:hypothetical protein
MSISVFSYAGTLRMSVMTDRAVLSNPSKLTEMFVDEFQEMYKQIQS